MSITQEIAFGMKARVEYLKTRDDDLGKTM